MATAIEFNHVGKQYRLGLVSTGTISHDLNRWWQTAILRKEDPYLKIGSVNDRTQKADSDYVWALRDIDFKVEQGDVVGIIGKNGAGKSTLLKLLSKVTGPTVGSIRARGRIASLLEVGTGFHPEMTGRENIFMNGAIMGMTKAEIAAKLDEIVDFSGCEMYIDTPVKRYSSGMTVRLGFAVAAFLEPDILVVDEVLAVGDAEFQKKAIGKMQDVSKGEGRTVLFVSHNMASIRQLCTNGIVLKNGTVDFIGSIDTSVNHYLANDSFEHNLLIKTTKVDTDAFYLSAITLNNQDSNHVLFDKRGGKLCFYIEGCCVLPIKVSFEAMVYDEHQNLLASYTPYFNTLQMIDLQKGNFSIEETICLPENITSGDYYLFWYLTYPNIAHFTRSIEPIKISVKNLAFNNGMECTYKSRGFLSLY